MNRQEAIKILKHSCDYIGLLPSEFWDSDAGIIEAIDMAIEALQTNVVRCKDCKHRDEKCGMGEHRWCKILKMSTVPNDFCSYAERREP